MVSMLSFEFQKEVGPQYNPIIIKIAQNYIIHYNLFKKNAFIDKYAMNYVSLNSLYGFGIFQIC